MTRAAIKIDRRTFLFSTLAAAACSRSTERAAPLRKGAQFLWSQQSGDGAFRSRTYVAMRSGQSLTPFCLNSLLQVPESILPLPAGAIDRALDFIQRNVNADGMLGLMDTTSPDYPNYATALAVRAIIRAKRASWQQDMAPMVAALRTRQLTEDHGWKPDDPAYGAWGAGDTIPTAPNAGHVGISTVRFVLDALAAAGVPGADPMMHRAVTFLKKLQNPDGGFFFSNVNPEANKAGGANGSFASYGSATADGLLALVAAGVPEDDDRVNRARTWLYNNHHPDRACGLDAPANRAYATGLRFYYGAAVTKASPGLPVLLPIQKPDGSWRNSNNIVKEDDPLIATACALVILRPDVGD